MSREKHLFYARRTYFEHGYDHTEVTVFEASVRDVRELLQGTLDNRAGYGTEQAARELGEMYRGWLDQGYLAIVDSVGGYDSAWMRVTFLHYQAEPGTYCEPAYDLGRRIDQINNGLRLFKRVQPKRTRAGKYVRAPETPEELIARFPGITQVERTDTPHETWRREYYVPGLDLTLAKTG